MKNLLLSFTLLAVLSTFCGGGVTNRKCYVGGQAYDEGEEFKYNSDRTGCTYNCTCVILNRRALGNCTYKCQTLSYPPGCVPVYNPCGCAINYTCIDGEKCQDPITRSLYAVGEKWSNATCTCNCIGQQRGAYRCECKKLIPVKFNPNLCIPDNETVCYSCPSGRSRLRGDPNCGKRGKCEQWPYTHIRNGREIPMTCTCHGPRGFTQCVWRKVDKRSIQETVTVDMNVQVTSAESSQISQNLSVYFVKLLPRKQSTVN